MNAYFQIVPENGKCAIKLFPPTNGGSPINREEILEYLSIKNLSYDVKALGSAIADLNEITTIPTTDSFVRADGEYVRVIVSPDNMTVTVRMIPPFEGGSAMDKTEFMREFSSRGISFGFDEPVIGAFLKTRVYCTDVVVAKGLKPVQGTNASIEYFFNTDPKVRPTQNEDGTVDFFNLNTINHCLKGDLLARLTPAVKGTPGKNVKGEIVKAYDVKSLMLKYGHNIAVNEDKTELRSEVNGHVSLVEGKVFVSDVFEVENVDNSIGNIDYDGSVTVNGNVCENFSIKAKGSIVVKGVVEGAYLESGENIIIARGMNGMHKGTLKAKGNVISKFLENATVNADGYVESESILHSAVTSGSDIKVVGRKGFISGGRCTATNSIEVKNLGSSMGADTVVEVGMDVTAKQDIQRYSKEIADINKQLATIKPVLDGAKQKLQNGIKMTTDQLLQIQKLATLHKEQSARLELCMEELSKLQDNGDEETRGQVVVTGDVFPGTKICIGDVSMVVKSSMKYCRFVKEGGEVKMVAIY